MFYTVTEKWDWWHTNEIRVDIHNFLDKLETQGKFLRNHKNERSVYNADGSPTKIFSNLESAEEYIAFISKLNPTSTIINQFETKNELMIYLNSVTDSTHNPESGPSIEDHFR